MEVLETSLSFLRSAADLPKTILRFLPTNRLLRMTPSFPGNGFLNDALIGNGSSLNHKFTVDGVNEINLITTTTQGCRDTLTRHVNVLSAPKAAFVASSLFGIQGSDFDFTNTSEGASTYQWRVDGAPADTGINFDTVFQCKRN